MWDCSLSGYSNSELYYESSPSEFFPLPREKAEELGYRWMEVEEQVSEEAPVKLPDNLDDIGETICSNRLICQKSRRPYRIERLELTLLRKMGIAPSRLAPEQRRKGRAATLNQARFWQRTCSLKGEPIITSFPPDSKLKVYCEDCYKQAVYGEG